MESRIQESRIMLKEKHKNKELLKIMVEKRQNICCEVICDKREIFAQQN